MEPFYFGKKPNFLFGVYHAPQNFKKRNTGIVLCHPMGDEYIHSHRAFLQLAEMLCIAGFHVLRFDFLGCGDSAGGADQWNIDQWTDIILTAIQELKSGCDAPKIGLIGLRLGASLSIIASRKYKNVNGLILWKLITNGNTYMNELESSHRNWLQGSFARPKPFTENYKREILGFLITDHLRKEIKEIDLTEYHGKFVDNILLIDDNIAIDNKNTKFLEHIGNNLTKKNIPGQIEKNLVPIHVLENIVNWASEVFQ